MLPIVGGTLLGWGLGANDAANVFGTAVSSRMLRWRTAAILASLFIIAGAAIGGQAGIETLSSHTAGSASTSLWAALCAALTVAGMTVIGLPVSTSQAVVGGLAGAGIAHGSLNTGPMGKVLACWIGTPIGAMLVAFIAYRMMRIALSHACPTVFSRDPALRFGLLVFGCYGAYALGANNVANVATFFVFSGVPVSNATLLGGITIALGVLTFSKRVMLTVGKGISPLDGFSALVVVIAQAVTVHIYANVGVPVSSSQAVVGAVLGIGMAKGMHIINPRILIKVALGWLAAPALAALMAWSAVRVSQYF